jgi:uncharacterized membrane protein SpoIIM required for sporulation
MKEIVFLKNNAEKWKKFESLLKKREGTNPDSLADLFIEITDDLSYAKTFYPGSKTAHYLNSLASRLHRTIYKNKREESKRFFTFWKRELPLLFTKHRRALLYSFIIFMAAISVGVISSAGDNNFVKLILGDSYIKMTVENIEKGDPMAVYKSMNEMDMFLGITYNNIMVAMVAFAFGVFFSFGTGYILFNNGIMIGAFHYFFYKKGLLLTSVLSIWIHGTLEISSIIIAGSAGIVIGNSILFPGTYSRARSFTRGAREGLKILIGIIPLFIVAAFLEGFVTRLTDMPRPVSVGIISASFLFVIWYVIIYPIIVKRKVDRLPEDISAP